MAEDIAFIIFVFFQSLHLLISLFWYGTASSCGHRRRCYLGCAESPGKRNRIMSWRLSEVTRQAMETRRLDCFSVRFLVAL